MQALFDRGTAMMHWQDRIGFDPGVLGGKPVIKGTRLAFVSTRNRAAIFFSGAISEARCEYSRSCSPESSTCS
jgi:hypothetical protein